MGANHPAVGVSAHGLANVYVRMQRPKEAHEYFRIALDIYKGMHLPKNHPTVTRLLNDRRQLKQFYQRRT